MPPDAVPPETVRLRWRRFTAEDAALLQELDSDPEVMRFISKGQPTSRERIEGEILPRWLRSNLESPPRGFWAAHLSASGAFAGWFHLRPDRLAPAEMELGYRLRRSVWGQGLGTEGARGIIEAAFRTWNYPRISARTLVDNAASRRVMEKAGLRFEGEFTYPEDMLPGWTERERRGVKYALDRAAFEANAGPARASWGFPAGP